MRNLASAQDRPARLLRRAWRRAPPPSRRSPRRRRRCSCNLDTTFTALADVAARTSRTRSPRARRRSRRRSATARISGRSWPTAPTCSPSSSPASRRSPTRRRTSPSAVTVGTPALKRSPAFNARLATTFKALETFATDPLVKLGVQDLTSTVVDPRTRRSRSSRRRRRSATTSALFFRNVSSLLSEGGTNGRRCASRSSRRRAASRCPASRTSTTRCRPNNEGGPSSAPANGPAAGYDATTCTPTRTRTPRRRASRRVRGRQRAVPRRQASIGNVPGQTPTTLHDNTTQALMAFGRDTQERAPAHPAQGPHGRATRSPSASSCCSASSWSRTSGSRRTCRSRRGFQFKAVFQSANSIRLNSPVRIAGVNVGKCQEGRGPGRAPTTPSSRWRSRTTGLPIHKDAELKIRPRIFLEGNFFVDLQPGHAVGADDRRRRHDPGHADRDPGAARPGPDRAAAGHARGPAGRRSQELGTALNAQADRGRGRRPAAGRPQGKTAAQSLNDAISYGVPALRERARSSTRRCWAPSRRPDRARPRPRQRSARSSARAGAAARGAGHELQHDDGRARRRAGAAAARRSPSSARRSRTAYDALGALNAALPDVRAFALE